MICQYLLLLTLACACTTTASASRIPIDASLCEVMHGAWQVHVHPSNTVANIELSLFHNEANDMRTWSVSTATNPNFGFNAVVIGPCDNNADNAMLEVDVGVKFGSHKSEDVMSVMERVQMSVSTSWKDSRVASGTFKECTVLLTVLSRSVFQLVWMCPGQLMHSALGQRTSEMPVSADTTNGSSWSDFWSGKEAQFCLIAGALGVLQVLKWRRRMASIDKQQHGRSGTSGSGGAIALAMKQRIHERRQAAKARLSSAAVASPATGITKKEK